MITCIRVKLLSMIALLHKAIHTPPGWQNAVTNELKTAEANEQFLFR